MRIRPLHFLLCSLLLGLAARPLDPPRARAQPADRHRIAVIVSATSKMRDISRALLRRVFLGEPSEFEGARLVPITATPGDSVRTAFDRTALGFTSEDSGRYWIDRRIRGQGLPPRSIPSPALIRAVVAKLPGAIGYVAADQLNPTVRALTVGGLALTDRAYPLVLTEDDEDG